ncbi:hypothetical protein BJ875DRAFT_490345 [Amylocarpus encephaloides]|uniref:EF-hand domain-containing protein n=1 Tax=Amylocarpus encephaloides TaxID=45428 RepID=A0A9P7Y565_9HELO|nr:hypothetical protein BJ875DRAFT_490345 [Amylocarpus encephaloides]
MSTLSQKTHPSERYYRNDTQAFPASRNLPNRSNDDDFPDMEELLSGRRQKSLPATADLNGDDHDGFIDIDELLSGMPQKGPTSVDPDHGGMAANMVNNGTRGGSPSNSSRSTARSSRDPIILGEDESIGAESETDYGSLNAALTAKSDSSSPHIADSDMADDDNDSAIVDSATLQLAADLPMSASPGNGTVTHQASPMQVNTEITQGSASYDDLDVTKEAEDEGIDVFADNEDDTDTCSTRRSRSSAVSSDNPASDSNPGLAAASHHQSDLTNDLVPRHGRRRDDSKNVRRKRLRTPALTGPASTASTVFAALESNDSERTQSVARLVAPAKEREIRDTDQEMVNDRGADYSNDEDYDDMSDAAASEIRRPPHSRKRVKRAKDMEHNDMETPSTHSLNVSYQATAATSSVSM